MRLTHREREVIRRAALDCFGQSAKVRLFGSRANDGARGGDIDLLIETDMIDVDAIVRAEIVFLVKVQGTLGEQKIDVLIDYPGRGESPPIFAVAERSGVSL